MYVPVAENEESDVIEIPTDDDGTISLSSLSANFSGATGMKFKVDGHVRLIKLKDDKLYPPEGGWDGNTYYCIFPKGIKRKSNDDDDSESKWVHTDLVVLGLPWKTTDKDLEKYFSQFGDLAMVQVKVDPITKRSKGYGFVRFVNQEVQVRVMLQRHQIDGRWCDVRIPVSRDGVVKKSPCKIFVGQCTEEMTEDVLRDYFSKYGVISDIYVPKPFRGFAFVTYVDSSSAKTVCSEDHIICNTKVYITEAVPKGEKDKFERIRASAVVKSGGSIKRREGRGGYYDRYDDDYYHDDYDRKRSWKRDDRRGASGKWDDEPWRKYSHRSSGREPAYDDSLVASVVNKAVMGVIGNFKTEASDINSDSYNSDWWSRK